MDPGKEEFISSLLLNVILLSFIFFHARAVCLVCLAFCGLFTSRSSTPLLCSVRGHQDVWAMLEQARRQTDTVRDAFLAFSELLSCEFSAAR